MARTKVSARYATVLLVAVLGLQPHAAANRKTVPDDTQTSDRARDIVSATHDHGPSDRILRHEIVFEGNPRPVSGAVDLFFRFRNGKGETVRRELRLTTNPAGGLYGVFYTPRYKVTGYAIAWVEDDSKLIVEFSVPTLGRLGNDTYRWHVWSILGAGEFENPCQGEDEGAPVCKDRAPAEGWIVHRL